MTQVLRKLNLTAHVVSSVGFLGAVASFLVLGIAGLTSQDVETVRGAYTAMYPIGLFAIVPLCLAALLTGIVQSLGTEWGLLRHYWILVKLMLTAGATILLLLHQFTAVAGAAKLVSGTSVGRLPSTGRLGTQLVVDAGLAIVVLLICTILSMYKPWGPTRYGRSKTAPQRPDKAIPLGVKIFFAVLGFLAMGVILAHLTGHGLGNHGH